MSIQHHLDDATIMRYASGDLDEAFAIVVASHIAMCAECRRAVRLAEAVGGVELLEGGQSQLDESAFDRLMRRVDSAPDSLIDPKPADEGDRPRNRRRSAAVVQACRACIYGYPLEKSSSGYSALPYRIAVDGVLPLFAADQSGAENARTRARR